MRISHAIDTVHYAVMGAIEDFPSSESRKAKLLNDAWLTLMDHINYIDDLQADSQTLAAIYSAISNTSKTFKVTPTVSPSKSTPQNEYSSGSARPGSKKYDSVISFGTTVYSDEEDLSDLTKEEVVEAVTSRINDMFENGEFNDCEGLIIDDQMEVQS